MRPTTKLSIILAVTLAAGFGCEGQLLTGADGAPSRPTHPEPSDEIVETGPAPTTDPTETPEPVDIEECESIEPKPVADVPARLLTATEVENALATLFEDLDLPAVEMPLDTRVGSFSLNARENVSADHIRDFRLLAEDVASRVAENVDVVAPCADDDPAVTEVCAHDVVDDLATKAFRRPLTDDESTALVSLYDTGAAEAGHAEGMRWVVEAILQAPSFIYVTEDVATDRLDTHEIAQRMSAVLWRSIPDDALLQAAQNGELDDPAEREAHARRMLADDRGQAMIQSLVTQWLGLDRLSDQSFAQDEENAALAEAMGDETARLVEHVTTEGNSSWAELLTSRYAFVDQTLAAHYGVSLDGAEEVSDGVYRVEMQDRAGLLGQAGFLALHHGPVHRGLAIRKAILCDAVPGPDGVDTEAIPTEPEESERSKSMKRLDETACGGCHSMMDPLGLPFEVYGSLGQFRSEDSYGNPVSSDGELRYAGDVDGEVADSTELADRLAQSEDVRECVAENLFVWAFARTAAAPDGCTLARIDDALARNDDNLTEALVEIVAHDMFTRRATTGDQ